MNLNRKGTIGLLIGLATILGQQATGYFELNQKGVLQKGLPFAHLRGATFLV